MLDTLTLDQLRIFLTVAEAGSFSAAGRRLGRVQSAVGYGIAKLEESLGLSLFERSGRCITLTEAGRSLLKDAEAVFEQVGQLRQHADRLASRLEPSVCVAMEALLPGGFVKSTCELFKARFPGVSLHLRTEGLGGVAAVVMDGTCDLGVSGDYDLCHGLRTRRLGHLPVVAVASKEHPLAAHSGPIPDVRLRQESQILIEHARYGSGRAHSVLSENVLCVAGAEIKLELIAAGHGWGFVPEETVREALQRGELVSLHLEERGAAPEPLPIHAIVRRDAQLGPAAQWLFEALQLQDAGSASTAAA